MKPLKEDVRAWRGEPPPDEKESTPADIERQLRAVASAARTLRSSRLKDSTVALLISHSMPLKERLPPRDIQRVLEAAAELDKTHLKPDPEKKGRRGR